jgi:hypothetical protein
MAGAICSLIIVLLLYLLRVICSLGSSTSRCSTSQVVSPGDQPPRAQAADA